MITRVNSTVKGFFHPGHPHWRLITVGLTALILMIVLAGGVMAQEAKPAGAVGYYVIDGQLHWIIPGQGIDVNNLSGLTPSGLESLFPLTSEEEASIVHAVPPCPVIIDGVKYQASQISLFNGKRLRFVTGKDGTLYAFTTVQGLEQFMQAQYNQPLAAAFDTESMFYQDWFYTGSCFGLTPGYGIADLSQIGLDNALSSCEILTSTQWAFLFDNTGYQGDYFAMAPGSTFPWLANQGWNDRASSVWINQ